MPDEKSKKRSITLSPVEETEYIRLYHIAANRIPMSVNMYDRFIELKNRKEGKET